jgi:hypothetical protein
MTFERVADSTFSSEYVINGWLGTLKKYKKEVD